MQKSTAMFLLLFSTGLVVSGVAQETLYTLSYRGGNVQKSYSISDKTLRFEVHDFNDWGEGDGSGAVSVAELDLSTSEVRGQFFINLPCKDNRRCVRSHWTARGVRWAGTPDRLDKASSDLDIYCNDRQSCIAFVSALKATVAPPTEPTRNRTTQQQPSQPRSVPPPQPRNTSPTAAANTHVSSAGTGQQEALKQILDGISWRKSAPGKSALDQLARKTAPATNKLSRPTSERVTYAAFSQSGGFDANGAWGVGSARDLNGAVAEAENHCHEKSSLCGDQGYCALRSGLYGAWASDLKVAGNSAFACNLETEDKARVQAQAWCGDGCTVLWSGAGK
jgi:hypothetical protein